MNTLPSIRLLTVVYVAFTAAILMTLLASPALSAQFTLTPRASVSEEYTDNVFLTEDDKEHDWITGVSVGFEAGFLERTYGFSMSYDPEYVNYARSTQTNTWRHRAALSAWTDLSRNAGIEFSDRLLKTEDPLPEADIAAIRTGEPGVPLDPTIRLNRNSYLQNTATIRFRHEYAERSEYTIGYTYNILRNEKEARQQGIQDNDRHLASGGIEHWFSARWGADADLSHEWVDYETSGDQDRLLGSVGIRRAFSPHLVGFVRYSHSVVNYEDETEDDKVYNPSVGIEYDIAEDVFLLIDVGYFVNDYDLREDESGVTLDSRLTKSFQRGSIALSAIGGYDYSLGSAEDLGFQQFAEVGVSGTYQFARRVSGNLFGSYRFSDYVDTVPRREDEIIAAGAGISVQPLQWMTVSLNYTFRSVDSTTVTSYVENRGSLVITLAPAVPYRW